MTCPRRSGRSPGVQLTACDRLVFSKHTDVATHRVEAARAGHRQLARVVSTSVPVDLMQGPPRRSSSLSALIRRPSPLRPGVARTPGTRPEPGGSHISAQPACDPRRPRGPRRGSPTVAPRGEHRATVVRQALTDFFAPVQRPDGHAPCFVSASPIAIPKWRLIRRATLSIHRRESSLLSPGRTLGPM
jgi:hypothetical protein